MVDVGMIVMLLHDLFGCWYGLLAVIGGLYLFDLDCCGAMLI